VAVDPCGAADAAAARMDCFASLAPSAIAAGVSATTIAAQSAAHSSFRTTVDFLFLLFIPKAPLCYVTLIFFL
jgi:hypothetical protein